MQAGSSFVPTWQPPFISKLTPDDRCHLNGLALVGGVPTWATACGTGDSPAGWRDARSGGGVVLHIPTNRIAATGLSMPHSPRWHAGKLWLLNSGTGQLGWVKETLLLTAWFGVDNIGDTGLSAQVGVGNVLDAPVVYVQPYNGGLAPMPGRGREYFLRLTYALEFLK